MWEINHLSYNNLADTLVKIIERVGSLIKTWFESYLYIVQPWNINQAYENKDS